LHHSFLQLQARHVPGPAKPSQVALCHRALGPNAVPTNEERLNLYLSKKDATSVRMLLSLIPTAEMRRGSLSAHCPKAAQDACPCPTGGCRPPCAGGPPPPRPLAKGVAGGCLRPAASPGHVSITMKERLSF